TTDAVITEGQRTFSSPQEAHGVAPPDDDEEGPEFRVQTEDGKSRPATEAEIEVAVDVMNRTGVPCEAAALSVNPIAVAWRGANDLQRERFVRYYRKELEPAAQQKAGATDSKKTLHCSFCGKSEDDAETLIAAP